MDAETLQTGNPRCAGSWVGAVREGGLHGGAIAASAAALGADECRQVLGLLVRHVEAARVEPLLAAARTGRGDRG